MPAKPMHICVIATLMAGIFMLSACSGGDDLASATQFTRKNRAAILADEPQAALVGRDVLSLGGNPVDAAVSMALALTVTLPSRAGLLGGGSCLVHDPEAGPDEAATLFDFSPSPLPRSNGARSEYGAPGLLRGLFAMHARYGRLRFEQLVIPAERLARFDGVVSRSLDNDFKRFSGRLDRMQNIIWHDAGQVDVGERLPWNVMSGALAVLRQEGPGAFYGGRIGRQFAEELGLDPAAVAKIQPVIRTAPAVAYGTDRVHMAGGVEEQGILGEMATSDGPVTTALVGDAPPATGFIAKGAGDFVVACGLTQGMAFGIGEPATGFSLWPSRAVAASLPLGDGMRGPFMIANRNVGELRLAGIVTASDDLPEPVLDAAKSVFDGQRATPGYATRIVANAPAGDGNAHPRRSLISCTLADDDGERGCTAAIEPGVNGLAIEP